MENLMAVQDSSNTYDYIRTGDCNSTQHHYTVVEPKKYTLPKRHQHLLIIVSIGVFVTLTFTIVTFTQSLQLGKCLCSTELNRPVPRGDFVTSNVF